MPGGLQAGDAGIPAVAELLRLGALRGGVLRPALERVGGGEAAVGSRVSPIGGARLFEPGDRLVDAFLQQVPMPDPVIPDADIRIARAEADRALLQCDPLGD